VYMLVATGASSASPVLLAGTYQLVLDTRVSALDDHPSKDYTVTVTQCGSISGGGVSASVSTSIYMARQGGAGYGRNMYGTNINASGNFTLNSPASITLTLNDISSSYSGVNSQGSILTINRV